MSQFRPAQQLSIAATAALTARRFVTAAGAVPAAGSNAFGVALSDAVSGTQVPVVTLGTAPVVAGAAIAAGAAVEVAADGKAITKTTGIAVGRALTAASADGDTAEIFLIPN